MMKRIFNIFSSPSLSWRRIFEDSRQLRGLLMRAALAVFGHHLTEIGIAAYLFSKRVMELRRHSGLLFTALYLKQCGVTLQHYYGCHSGDKTPTVAVSLTRSGLPRIIPAFHRHLIRKRDDRSDRLVKLYLSWFTLNRLVTLVAKASDNKILSSIVTPAAISEDGHKIIGRVERFVKRNPKRYVPHIRNIMLYPKVEWRPTWKSLPHIKKVKGRTGLLASLYGEGRAAPMSLYWWEGWHGFDCVAPLELKSYGGDRATESEIAIEVFGAEPPYPSLFAWEFSEATEPLVGDTEANTELSGRLSVAFPGGGKRRIKAIGNYFRQVHLYPYHRWTMEVFSSIPNDGTFDQSAPLRYVRGYTDVYSFDLSSATDRFPLAFIENVNKALFGQALAHLTIGVLLGKDTFEVKPPLVSKPCKVSFAAGQPLGYYLSWASFALSHHILVWMAARTAGIAKFTDYSLLGDDIVIANEKVAVEYARMIDHLGVKISQGKSIISTDGSFEFAKQFWVKGGVVDLSPVSLRSLSLSRSVTGLQSIKAKYKVNTKCLLRLAGAGYRVLAKLHSPSALSGVWKRLLACIDRPQYEDAVAFEWWLGGDKPLNPYIKGQLFQVLVTKFRPKDLKIDDVRDYLGLHGIVLAESTVLRAELRLWRSYLQCYCELSVDLSKPLSSFFLLPQVEVLWYRTNRDLDRVSEALAWSLRRKVMRGMKMNRALAPLHFEGSDSPDGANEATES